MRRPQSTFSPEVRAKEALAALKGDKTVAELAERVELHDTRAPSSASKRWRAWLDTLPKRGGGSQAPGPSYPDLRVLHAEIGQLTLENDYRTALFVNMDSPWPRNAATSISRRSQTDW